jgi:hypothetical protein
MLTDQCTYTTPITCDAALAIVENLAAVIRCVSFQTTMVSLAWRLAD